MGRYSEWKVSEEDRAVARSGLEMQAEAVGLDLNNKVAQDFIKGRVEVQALMSAEIRWLRNIINNRVVDK